MHLTSDGDTRTRVRRENFVSLAGSLGRRGGMWVVKRGDSSNARDMLVFGSRTGPRQAGLRPVWREMLKGGNSESANRGEERVAKLLESAAHEEKRSWIVQKYIERYMMCRLPTSSCFYVEILPGEGRSRRKR